MQSLNNMVLGKNGLKIEIYTSQDYFFTTKSAAEKYLQSLQ